MWLKPWLNIILSNRNITTSGCLTAVHMQIRSKLFFVQMVTGHNYIIIFILGIDEYEQLNGEKKNEFGASKEYDPIPVYSPKGPQAHWKQHLFENPPKINKS